MSTTAMDASSPVPPGPTSTPSPLSALASTPASGNTAATNTNSLGHLSPLPANTYPPIMSTSPSGSRKRSIQDSEMGGMASENHPTADSERNMDVDIETTGETIGAGAGDRTSVSMQQSTTTTTTTSTPDDDKENHDGLWAQAHKVAGSDADATTAIATGEGEGNSSLVPSTTPSSDTARTGTAASGAGAGSFAVPASKKRKLSPSSKEAKQQEKEAKERLKQQEKARREEEKEVKERQKVEEKARKEEEKRKREAEREEEKRAKEEERKKRDAEKEEKRKVKEEEKAAKEEERRKKEEEKSKKERGQTKLNSFFVKPKPGIASSAPSSTVTTTTTTTSLSPQKMTGAGAAPESSYDPAPSAVSDYQREFPDFFLQSHTKVAPPHQFQRDADALHHTQEKVDAYLKSAATEEPPVFRPSELFNLIPYRRRRGRQTASVKEILLQMQNLADQAETSEDAHKKPQELLRQVRMKSFRFGEDVRPPYQGTFTKRLSESTAHRLMRNPFHRGLPEVNYDYDSEAEWEEPEEGEELDSEEEDEMSEDGEDDMDGFLDDEDDHLVDGKRRLIVGDLEPVSTGIRWQGHGVDSELQMYKLETISDSVPFPIDPFSTVYWQKPKPAESAPSTMGLGRSTLHAFMSQTVSGSHKGSVGGGSTADGSALAVVTAGRTKQRTFPAEKLGEFKQVVDGSDLTKLGLLEILKKRFPKVSKDVLKDTLNSVATRVGQKEADKKWVCK
ncbi:putative chromatin assembly factor 1 subunit A [Aspergillus homomorphus CBS 101889]|uniref:Chromatin assembly factor 1 subunit A n=1 Tax=Aspergillus homomorphus (strain CBS 101889) TaxID=1450537 RepID=A0A395HGP1_ASPHC|nr:hypothetical protein BO97DRAFT_447201 [Aspergillus homomorphus CBS 101889]RAL07007.1 hypothetical protein BO97DRAFT_447201 [Aspergillus homomorphus CBS 101889]